MLLAFLVFGFSLYSPMLFFRIFFGIILLFAMWFILLVFLLNAVLAPRYAWVFGFILLFLVFLFLAVLFVFAV